MTFKEDNMSLGERLLMLRTKNNMTQEALAECLNVSRQSISKWELDKALPDIEKLIQLSEIYDVSMDYLIKGILPESTEKPKIELTNESPMDQNFEEMEVDFKKNDKINNIKKNDFIMAKKYIYMLCAFLSGVLFLIIFIFSVKNIYNDVSVHDSYNQENVYIDKIYKQYTKAEISGVDDKGDFFSEVLWIDIPGVKEKDFVFGFTDSEQSDKFYFDYYLQTLLTPIIIGIIMLIFFISFCLAFINTKKFERKE